MTEQSEPAPPAPGRPARAYTGIQLSVETPNANELRQMIHHIDGENRRDGASLAGADSACRERTRRSYPAVSRRLTAALWRHLSGAEDRSGYFGRHGSQGRESPRGIAARAFRLRGVLGMLRTAPASDAPSRLCINAVMNHEELRA
jgi:hypothetical protein